MRHLASLVSVLMLLFTCSFAMAQDDELSLERLHAMNAKKLSKEDLEQILPGARIERWGEAGGLLYWTNNADGKLFAVQQGRGSGSGHRDSTGPGTWRISEDGRYCVDIDWSLREREKWCREIYQADSHHYMAKPGKSGQGGKAHLLKIKK